MTDFLVIKASGKTRYVNKSHIVEVVVFNNGEVSIYETDNSQIKLRDPDGEILKQLGGTT